MMAQMMERPLLGVLNILKMDDNPSYSVKAFLPDGRSRMLTCSPRTTMKQLISPVCKEFALSYCRVKLLPSKALADIDSDVSILENHHEIVIEVADKQTGQDCRYIDDERFHCVKEFLMDEERYLDALKYAFDVYEEPLRKWGLNKADHYTLFSGLEHLCALSAQFFEKLDEAADAWIANEMLIGVIFADLDMFWTACTDYYVYYRAARLLLKDKREVDTEFSNLLHNQRSGPVRHSLEALITLPIPHVYLYEKLLVELLERTPADHSDYEPINLAVIKIRQILRDHEEEIIIADNEFKLIHVQDKFPHDNLRLQDSLAGQKTKGGQTRRRSAPSMSMKTVITGKPAKSGESKGKVTIEPSFIRTYVKEGPVLLTSGVSSQDRYLFLFNDLLLIAKSKSPSVFRLKKRLRVSELWTGNCIDEVSEATRAPDMSFVIGWPTNNMVATFSSPEEKEEWINALTKNLKDQKELEEPKSVSIKIYNKQFDSSETNHSKSFPVSNLDNASTVIKTVLDEYQIQYENSNEYQLWVLSGKEEEAYPLLGHEYPFAIKMTHVRESMQSCEEGLIDFDQLPNMDPLSPETQCQFILKRSRKLQSRAPIDQQTTSPKKFLKNSIKRSPIINWAMNKKGTTTKSSTHGDYVPPTSPTPGKLFGHPLQVLLKDGEIIPRPLLEILLQLFRYGPATTGIFRKSANARVAKEVKDELNAGKEVCTESISVLVLASVFKEFLRKLPNCIFCCELYEEFVNTNNIEDIQSRSSKVKELLTRLPNVNFEVLKRSFAVLYHIQDHSNTNNMTPYNLAVCIAPSMFWPAVSSNVPQGLQSACSLPFVQFLIENCQRIFGEDIITILGDPSDIRMQNEHSTDDEGGSDPGSPPIVEGSETLTNGVKTEEIDDVFKDSLIVDVTSAVRNSRSSPNSPCNSAKNTPQLKRHDMDYSDPVRATFYESTPTVDVGMVRRSSEPYRISPDSLGYEHRFRLRPFRKQLTSTTTSAELIEHKPIKNRSPGVSRRSDGQLNVSAQRRSHSPQNVHLYPVVSDNVQVSGTGVPEHGDLKQAVQTKGSPSNSSSSVETTPDGNSRLSLSAIPPFERPISPSADQVFQVVDRRRQPAAPSYQAHMQRKRDTGKPAFFHPGNNNNGESGKPAVTRTWSNPLNSLQEPKQDVSKSEPSTPTLPDSKERHDSSSDSLDSRRSSNESTTSPGTRRMNLSSSLGSAQLKHALNSSGTPLSSSHTHFPQAEFFPQEAALPKSTFPSETRPSAPSTIVISSSNLSSNRYRSHTSSSSSSVSSSEEHSSVGSDSAYHEGRSSSVTQIQDIRDLINGSAHANGLKISQKTAEEIAKLKQIEAPRRPAPRVPAPETKQKPRENPPKTVFSEESYV